MASRVSLRHLRCFVAVADTGSFTLAAGRLFQTQSALTATIQQLETSVGLRLFDRTTRRVEMTDDATRFKVVADKIIRDFDSAIGDLQAVAKSQRGHLRIAAAPSVMTHILAPTLSAFRKEHPEISIAMHDGGSQRIEHAVLAGEIDFGISSPLNNLPGLTYAPLFADPFGVVFPVGHQLDKARGDVAWSDIEEYGYVGLNSDTGIGAQLDAVEPFYSMIGKHSYDRASSTTSLYALLRLGDRISILPALAANTGPMQEFKFRRLKSPDLNREICLITRSLRSVSPSTQLILDMLVSTIKTSNDLRCYATR